MRLTDAGVILEFRDRQVLRPKREYESDKGIWVEERTYRAM